MNLNGMTIHFLGDSITEGAGTTAPEKVYHQRIKELYHLKEAHNYGVGGTRIAPQVHPSYENTVYDLYFSLRAKTMDQSADAIVVFGGTNDYGHGDALFGTVDSTDANSFCGAVHTLIQQLKQDFPKAKIVFMTPIHRLGETEPSQPENKILKDYADAMVTICEKNAVPVIDLFRIDPLDPSDEILVPDGLHPSDAGNEILAKVVAEELMKL